MSLSLFWIGSLTLSFWTLKVTLCNTRHVFELQKSIKGEKLHHGSFVVLLDIDASLLFIVALKIVISYHHGISELRSPTKQRVSHFLISHFAAVGMFSESECLFGYWRMPKHLKASRRIKQQESWLLTKRISRHVKWDKKIAGLFMRQKEEGLLRRFILLQKSQSENLQRKITYNFHCSSVFVFKFLHKK